MLQRAGRRELRDCKLIWLIRLLIRLATAAQRTAEFSDNLLMQGLWQTGAKISWASLLFRPQSSFRPKLAY